MSYSQDVIRRALDEIPGLIVYKPSDRDANWKPCDYMVWWEKGAAWIEVKQTTLRSQWTWVAVGEAQLRPAQIRGMQRAHDIDLPYVVALYWKSRRYWTLHRLRPDFPLRITFEEAVSSCGVGAAPANLALTLRSVIEGEAGL